MTYRVEELAAVAEVRVDTIRYYQSRKLLPPPRRVRRLAIYADEHLTLLRRIRRYQSQGFSLAVIKRLLSSRRQSRADALLAAVADESGERLFTRAQLARQSGVPEPLVASLEAAGLLEPVLVGRRRRYGEADLQMARAGLEILRHGFPLDKLLRLALRHARGVQEVVDAAIDLFDRYARGGDGGGARPEDVTAAFQRLLPAVTTLVALHFQRTLLTRARGRLRRRGHNAVARAARSALREGRLEIRWR